MAHSTCVICVSSIYTFISDCLQNARINGITADRRRDVTPRLGKAGVNKHPKHTHNHSSSDCGHHKTDNSIVDSLSLNSLATRPVLFCRHLWDSHNIFGEYIFFIVSMCVYILNICSNDVFENAKTILAVSMNQTNNWCKKKTIKNNVWPKCISWNHILCELYYLKTK